MKKNGQKFQHKNGTEIAVPGFGIRPVEKTFSVAFYKKIAKIAILLRTELNLRTERYDYKFYTNKRK